MKLLIANRGEIAVRIARTCAALGIPTVAVHSDADAGALHVAACDEAVHIGGDRASESYLRVDALLAAAARTGATAVHPGYGFLSERADAARAVVEAGLTWVGPSPDTIAAMGDKLAAKRLLGAAGVPVLPGIDLADGAAPDPEAAAALGYPLLVKAAAGGGGRGMRLVTEPGALAEAVAAARREAAAAFGDGRVFLERAMPRPHHVEVQILGDTHGGLVHLHERECSIQRRYQKVIEESPAPRLGEELRRALCAAAVTAGRALGYASAGTVEFVAGERDGMLADFALIEVNTRLQVEHPVTEQVVRVRRPHGHEPIDLVALQLAVAEGLPLPFTQDQVVVVGHAIEARLYAEDARAGDRPSPGVLRALLPPAEPVVRWDLGVRAGDEVTSHYDPLLAKVVAHAGTRDAAVRALARALEGSLIAGVTTNRDLLVAVLRDEVFRSGAATTGFLADREVPLAAAQVRGTEEVAAAAAVAALAGLLPAHAPGLPQVPPGFTNGPQAWPPVRFRTATAPAELEVRHRTRRDGTFDLEVDGVARHARVASSEELGGGVLRLAVALDGHRRGFVVARAGACWSVCGPAGQVDLEEVGHAGEAAPEVPEGACVAPLPGLVVALTVREGAAVARGAVVAVVEAMKLEHRITAPLAGHVAKVLVATGEQVVPGQVLVQLEPR